MPTIGIRTRNPHLLDTMVTMTFRSWLVLALFVAPAIRFLSFRYIYGLRRFKGPLLASFTNAWRFLYSWRNTNIPLKDVHDRYGDVVRVGPNALSFRDPQAIRDIFGAGKNWAKSDRYSIQAAVTKGEQIQTLFSSLDPTWHKNVRKVLNPFFTLTTISTYESVVEKNIEVFTTELDNRFVDKHGTEGVIDFPRWLSFFVSDVISDLTWSKPYGFILRGEDVLGMIGWVSHFLQYGFVVGEMPSLNLLLRHNPFLMWLERRGWYSGDSFPGSRFAIQRISEREQRRNLAKDGADGREDILDKVRRAKLERPDHITDKEVMGITLSTMFAGAETTAISLSAIFYYVLRTPGCHSKLLEELDTHLQPASSATDSTYFQTPFSEARELPYLHACIQEAFRMHPALGLPIERVVPPSGATICGDFIPGGTLVGCNAWAVHRNKNTFGEDCDSYRPERWLEDAEIMRKKERAMLQFGAGNHVCLGQNIALMEIHKLVPSLLKTYEISLVDPEKEWTIINGQNMDVTDFNVRIKRRADV